MAASRWVGVCLTAGVSLLAATPRAAEPEGAIRFEYAWIENGAPAAEGARLRVAVTALEPVLEGTIEFRWPPAVAARALAPPEGVAESAVVPGETLPPRVRLGSLARGAVRAIDLVVARNGDGIAVVTLEGRRADGRPVAEAVGIPVGTPGVAPSPRNGALEFGAAHPPPEAR